MSLDSIFTILVPIGRTTLCLCYHRFSANGDCFRPYRNIIAAKIPALSFALLSQLTIFIP